MADPATIETQIDCGNYIAAEQNARSQLEGINPLENAEVGDLLDLLVESFLRGGKATWPETLGKAELTIENRKLHGDPERRARILTSLAMILFERGHDHYSESRRLLARAELIVNKPEYSKSIERGWVLTYYTILLHETGGDEKRIINLQKEALSIFADPSIPPGHGWFQRQSVGAGLILQSKAVRLHDKGEDAERPYKDARAIRAKLSTVPPGNEALPASDPTSRHPDFAGTEHNLGVWLHEQGRFSEARKCYENALRIRERLGNHHPHLADTRANIVLLDADESRGL